MSEVLYAQDAVSGTSLRGSALFYSAILAAASVPAATMVNNAELAYDQIANQPKIYEFQGDEPTNFGNESLGVELHQTVDEEISALLTDFADQQVSLDTESQAILNDNLWDLYITA